MLPFLVAFTREAFFLCRFVFARAVQVAGARMHQGIQDNARVRDRLESNTVDIVRGVTKTIYVVVVDPPVKEGDPFDSGFFPLRAPRSGVHVLRRPYPSMLSSLILTVSVPVLFPLQKRQPSLLPSHSYIFQLRLLIPLIVSQD